MALRRTAFLLAIMASTLVFGPQSSAVGQALQTQSGVSCPEMTDSIIRLYQGFFLQAPDSEMFKALSSQYRTGRASLVQIGDELAASENFELRYGVVSNERFITLAFRNVLAADPTDAERSSWAKTLASGYSRGAFMLALTESEGFVKRTGTTSPLAGYLRWYPAGTQWYCGDGPVAGLTTPPLTGLSLYADYMIRSDELIDTPFGIYTLEGDTRNVTVASGSMPGLMTMYRWDGSFSGDQSYGANLDVVVAEDVGWIIVLYPESIGEGRLGWQITD